jgi:hypothetical protein
MFFDFEEPEEGVDDSFLQLLVGQVVCARRDRDDSLILTYTDGRRVVLVVHAVGLVVDNLGSC